MKDGDVFVLENVCFYSGEEKNDFEFVKVFVEFVDVYVNDVFGVVYCVYVFIVGIVEYLLVVVGFLMEKEFDVFGKVVFNFDCLFIVIIGGVKVKDKIGVIESFFDKVDNLIIGGGFVYIFVKVFGYEVGKFFFEEDKIEFVKLFMDCVKEKGVNFYMFEDVFVVDDFFNDVNVKIVLIFEIFSDLEVIDIGMKICEIYVDVIKNSKFVVWNGLMGVFEIDLFV